MDSFESKTGVDAGPGYQQFLKPKVHTRGSKLKLFSDTWLYSENKNSKAMREPERNQSITMQKIKTFLLDHNQKLSLIGYILKTIMDFNTFWLSHYEIIIRTVVLFCDNTYALLTGRLLILLF